MRRSRTTVVGVAAAIAMVMSMDAPGALAGPCYETDWDTCVARAHATGYDVDQRALRKKLRAKCEQGTATACVVVGIMQASGWGGIDDTGGSEYSLWRACDLDLGACVPISRALSSGDHVDNDESFARAIMALRRENLRATAGDESRAPTTADSTAVVRAPLAALASHLEDCLDFGIAGACAKAAAMYARGAGTDRDGSAAHRYFEMACALDRTLCMDIAQAYGEGEFVPRNRKRSQQFRDLALQRGDETGCRYGDGERCVTYGYAYLQGERVWHDAEYAALLFTEACDEGSARGCAALAALRWTGEGIAKSRGLAVALYTRACDAKEGAACWKLGRLYLRGEQVNQDTTRAEELFRTACDLGNQASCDYLRHKP